MNASLRLDLHMHSTVSDGTDSPAELLDHVREAGLGLFALTDHDAVKGCRSIRALLREGDPVFLNGAEFSCRDGEGKYHILGYGFDTEAEPIRRLADSAHAMRMRKLLARLDCLKKEFGFEFPQEELSGLLAMDNPGKPHIAGLMIRHGYAGSMNEAVKQYLNRLHLRTEYFRPETVIRAIIDAGGVPVLAHPAYGDGDQLILGDELDARVRRLMDFGLRGLEAHYSGFTPRICHDLLALAERCGLYVTAGSDYHGKNKLIALGDTGIIEPDLRTEGLRRFLADMWMEQK